MLRKTFAWLLATVLAIGLSGCFDGDGNKQKLAQITQQPANATVTAGATATFSVSATGKGISYQWQRGTTNIAGATSATYTTPATTGADDGATFRVVITNKKGDVTSSAATLTVNVPPAISTAPVDAAVDVGATATFSVVATGTRLSYQWQRGTTNIAGATGSTYTTPVTVLTDDGATFRVVVTNAAGTATSAAATLTVNDPTPPPPPTSTFRTTPMVTSIGQGGVALKADGTVWAWGTGGGTGQTAAVTGTPTQVRKAGGAPLDRITKISGGLNYVLALDADGHVWIWGAADVPGTANPVIGIYEAEQVLESAGGSPLSNIVDVAAGHRVSAVARDDGRVLVWGLGEEGSTAQGTTATTRLDYPTLVPNLTGVVEVAATTDAVHARTADGRVYMWGKARGGALGSQGSASTGILVQVSAISSAVRLAVSPDAGLAIVADGSARVWGASAFDGTAGLAGVGVNCPYQALGTTTVPKPSNGSSTYSSIAASSTHELYVFGGRLYQVGDLIEDAQSNNGCYRTPTEVTGLTGIVGVSRIWGPHAFVWTADGRVYGVGNNSSYNLGVGNNSLLTGFQQIVGFNLLGDAPVGTDFLFLDFETPLPSTMAPGTGTRVTVQGFAGVGAASSQFTGSMLRSATGNVVTLALTDLPAHTSINLAFLFAAIDSLDGAGSFPAGDYLKITLDGETIFREAFANADPGQVQTYLPPPGVELARRVELGFGAGTFYYDSAYDMGADPRFQLIPHTASTLTLTFEIESSVLQGIDDESWGMDNLRISLNP
jgi:alpha-tubulin suppressor-like RCC1 family protein